MQFPDSAARDGVAHTAAALTERLRLRAPRVHCVTNAVAQNFTANMLLAAGCVPSMTVDPEEIGSFVVCSGALLVNLGTFDRERRQATAVALEAAAQINVPWVLDPVFIDRAPARAVFARELIARAPAVVRLNHAEFAALAGAEPTSEALAEYARAHKVVVALSGETDRVTDGARLAAISNGDALMAKVTAMGCAGSALVAACLAIEPDAWRAATGALAMIGVAGEIAAGKSEGPGTFAAAIVDALHRLDGPTLLQRTKAT